MASVADTRAERYYYIFDSRRQRAVVVDRTTGMEYDWDAEARVQLIRHIADACGTPHLRRFALWCSRQTRSRGDAEEDATAADRLVEAARERLNGGEEAEGGVNAVRADENDAVLMASTVGLPRRDPAAARLLTAQACLLDDPIDAAASAAHMSERWAEFSADGDPQPAAEDMRERQIDWLLDRLLASNG